MKFYEFNEFPYYALIGADTEEQAIENYNEYVCELIEEDKDLLPDEITIDEAKIKYENSMNNYVEIYGEDETTEDTFEDVILDNPCTILIDGCLL